MKNVQKEGSKQLEVVDSKVTPPANPEAEQKTDPKILEKTQKQGQKMTPRQEAENTLNYLKANLSLLEGGLFIGKDTNVLIQVKAWIENQIQYMSVTLARAIAAENEGK